MPRVHYEKTIAARRDKVFDIVLDFESFATIMPRYFPSIRVRSKRDNVAVVEQHIRLSGRELVMMTKHVTQYPSMHEVFVLGGDCKGSHIVESYQEIRDGTRMIIDIKLGGIMKIGGLLGRGRIQRDFEEIADEFARIVEM